MSRPQTLYEMKRARYVRHKNGVCKGCAAPIAWFTTTLGKRMPFNLPIASEDAIVVPHHATCPNAAEFKGPKGRAEYLHAQREAAIEELAARTGARVVVALFTEGAVSLWLKDLNGEETRHELITEANRIRFRLNGPDVKAGA